MLEQASKRARRKEPCYLSWPEIAIRFAGYTLNPYSRTILYKAWKLSGKLRTRLNEGPVLYMHSFFKVYGFIALLLGHRPVNAVFRKLPLDPPSR